MVQEQAQVRGEDPTERPGGVLQRTKERVILIWRWLRAPEGVGRPISLRPRDLRWLLLLALGYLLLLALLGVALFQATRIPELVELVGHQPPPLVPLQSSSGPGPTPTALGSGGAIAFSLRQNGNTDIYALNQASRQLVRLTHHEADDRSPAWSPDGDYLAFASNRADNWDVYLLDLVSGALIRLTHQPGFDGNPSWSPDGRWLAFESYRDGNLDVYVMETGGSELHAVTTDPAADYAPAWAHEGQALAFTSLREGSKDIFVRILDEENQIVNVTQSPDVDEDKPSWSADGSRLAYVTGSQGQTSVEVAFFDWQSLSADRARTEFFGTGDSPAWAPDGESLVYAHIREGRSHLVAARLRGWALFHEVLSVEGLLGGLIWTNSPVSPRVIARAEDVLAGRGGQQEPLSFYAEIVQPTPSEGNPFQLIELPSVMVQEGTPLLSDQVNDSFNALRRRVRDDAGWDYLAELESAWLPLSYDPPTGHSRRSWHLCGRAFSVNQEPYEEHEPRIVLAREEKGTATYWRLFLRAARQDGSLGEPLRILPWDLNAREEGGRAEVNGGALMEEPPAGYYVDFTALAADYGWERVPSMWRWRYFWPDILWWEYRKTGDMTWWDAMLKVFGPEEVEAAFGPIPGRED